MKKLISTIILSFILLSWDTVGAAFDFRIDQRDSTDVSFQPRVVAHPTTTGFLSYNPTTTLPTFVTIGSGLSIVSNVLSATGTPLNVSAPTARSLSLATDYQCLDNSKACVITINLTSTASLSVSGGTTVVGEVRLNSTTGASMGNGTAVGAYKNSLTGTLTVGLNIQTDSYNAITVVVPPGYYFAIRQTTGTGLSIVSTYDQVIE